MHRRCYSILAAGLLALTLAGCHNKKVNNPLADVGSKQPDKVLFDRAMEQMKHNRFDQARIILQTLINTYPDSEYIARAKLAVGDSWYAEGGSAALAQAENEYKDFTTFFPNMPEAAEAQLKIANIHYRQMEKPDRDFTHAVRAEEEYRNLIQQYPDSKLLPEAKERLREVQEVLGEREFRIGRFYFLRESWAAAMARLQSLVDEYPLYSAADEALYMLGNIYEREVDSIRAAKFDETRKGKLIREFTDKAAAEYARILTRYPVSDRAGDAKKRLEALHRPVPTATPQAIAQNKAEEESRRQIGRFGRMKSNLRRSPDQSIQAATRVGEPTLVDPKPTNAPDIVRSTTAAFVGGASGGSNTVSVEQVAPGSTPPPNQPVPRSDSQPPAEKPDDSGIPELKPLPSADSAAGDSGSAAAGSASKAPAPPAQVNEAAGDPGNAAASGASSSSSSSSSAAAESTSTSAPANDKDTSSSSKKKKKKGLGKLNPF